MLNPVIIQVVDDPLHQFHGITAAALILSDHLNRTGLSARLISFRELRLALPELTAEPNHHILIHYEPGFYCESFSRRIWNHLRVNTGLFSICSTLALARIPFAIVVHEFYSPSSSHAGFFVSRLIDTLCLRLADAIIVSQRWLRSYLSNVIHSRVYLMPVFSNIGDPSFSLCKASRSLVFFGSPGSLQRFLSNSNSWSSILYQFTGLTLHILSSDISTYQASTLKTSFPFLKIRCHSGLDDLSVSRILAQSTLGITDYSQASSPPDSFAKSGVLAAFHQHGVSPLVLGSDFNFYGIDPLKLTSGQICYKVLSGLSPLIVNSDQLADTYLSTTSVSFYSDFLLSVCDHIHGS
jgi:hypothetical protein